MKVESRCRSYALRHGLGALLPIPKLNVDQKDDSCK